MPDAIVDPLVLRTPPRWHAGYSVLGRWLRRRIGDPWRAEGWLVIAFVGVGVGLLLVHFWAHAAWGPTPAAWGVALGVDALVLAFSVIGAQPGVEVRVGHGQMVVRQGRRQRTLALDAIRCVEPVDAVTFHRGLRRDPAVPLFATRLPATVLLLSADDETLALGLPEAERARLLTALEACADVRA